MIVCGDLPLRPTLGGPGELVYLLSFSSSGSGCWIQQTCSGGLGWGPESGLSAGNPSIVCSWFSWCSFWGLDVFEVEGGPQG